MPKGIFKDPTAKRGFASMTPEKRSSIARKGGASVPSHLRSFSRSHDLAVAAGRKGGQVGGLRRKEPTNAPS